MKVISHSADRFRNLKGTFIEADPSMNIIYGENGQGKTNIIESIWLFTGCYSFRTHKNSLLIADGEQCADTELCFYSGEREQNAKMKIAKTKEIVLNGSACESPRIMMGRFSCVGFSPSTLAVVKGAPGERRRLMDVALSLMKPNYAPLMSRYLHTLDQRNNLLKKISEKAYDENVLDIFDEELAKSGAKIMKYRLDYIDELRRVSGEIYEGISSSREKLGLLCSYEKKNQTDDEDTLRTYLLERLHSSRENDIKRLYTSEGPQSDDLIISLDGRDARLYGSQGQQRSCALALKLGEASVMGSLTGEAPVVLLDDVMSELDEGRQNFILNYLNSWQVFITCCDPSQLMRSENGRVFEVKNGTVSEK